MPSHESPGASAGPPKRPSLASRSSSGPTTQARSNSDGLSTSAQRHKASSRHVVGRMGPRVPSYTKNLSKLTKLTAANTPTTSTSPHQQMGHHKRNSSTQALAWESSSAALRKNHSETSLKKNRSSGQLVKLARPHSSRNVRIHGRREAKRNSQVLAPEGLENPTVRFDLGDEAEDQDDSWVEESASVSPNTTRSNTRANTPVRDINKAEVNDDNSEDEAAEISTSSYSKRNQRLESRIQQEANKESYKPETTGEGEARLAKVVPERDKITERLLHRNVSFNTTSQVSSISATGHDSSMTYKAGNQGHDNSDQELVSRFINGGSSSGTPRESSFLPHNDRADYDVSSADGIRRSKSTKNVSHASTQTHSHHSGSSPSISLPSSRTQQKLWLERASSNLEPQQVRPLSLLRPGRPGSLPLQALGGDGRLNAQLKHLFDQTDVEYCRVRLFQHPLNDAIGRLKEGGAFTQLTSSSKSNVRRPGQTVEQPEQRGHQANNNENKTDLFKDVEPRRARVMFQGIKEDDDHVTDSRASFDIGEAVSESDQRDEAKDICRRLWERHVASNEE